MWNLNLVTALQEISDVAYCHFSKIVPKITDDTVSSFVGNVRKYNSMQFSSSLVRCGIPGLEPLKFGTFLETPAQSRAEALIVLQQLYNQAMDSAAKLNYVAPLLGKSCDAGYILPPGFPLSHPMHLYLDVPAQACA